MSRAGSADDLVVSLVALSLGGDVPPDRPCAPASASEWAEVAHLAALQGVTGLALRGATQQLREAPRALQAQGIAAAATSLGHLSDLVQASQCLIAAQVTHALAVSAGTELLLHNDDAFELRDARLLIAAGDRARAARALSAAACEPLDDAGRAFRSPGGRELWLMSADWPLEQVTTAQVRGVALPILPPAERLVALCLAAKAELWRRLDTLAAIAIAARVVDASFAGLARSLDAGPIVERSRHVIRERLGVDLPRLAAHPGPRRTIRKLILRQFQSPGDLVMLSAAIRDLHTLYPGRFVTDVRTPCPDLWLHNPYVTPIDDDDPEADTFTCEYPLIHRSNQSPHHFLHGFIEFLNERLGLQITPTAFRGDVHLSQEEREAPHPFGGKPYWLVSAGGKLDFTIKWWSPARYQQVVDRLSDRVQFVQVGESGHVHPALRGVVDLRGRTSLRELIRLVHHAEGVLGPVSLLMHLAAAVERPRGRSGLRPAVIVAGGREPVQWEAYPGHRFLHTIGALDCCEHGGCWRSRTLPIGDGDEKDLPHQLCVDVVDALPRCMDMITADAVVNAIEPFLAKDSPWTSSAVRSRFEPPPTHTPQVTFAVLTHGDDLHKIERCLDSIQRFCPRDRYTLVVGANGVSAAVREFLSARRRDGFIDRLVESPTNIYKCPMMRRMFRDVRTDLVWWLDNDSYFTEPEAFEQAMTTIGRAPGDTVIWGQIFWFSSREEWGGTADTQAFIRSAPWYRGRPLPGEPDDNGVQTDTRWYFPTGGSWVCRTSALRALDWPEPRMTICSDDVLLGEAVRQQGWHAQDFGRIGVVVNDAATVTESHVTVPHLERGR